MEDFISVLFFAILIVWGLSRLLNNSNEECEPNSKQVSGVNERNHGGWRGTVGEEGFFRRFFRVHKIEKDFFLETEVNYHRVKIPKNTGGYRTLTIPSDELKRLQTNLAIAFSKELSRYISKYAHAYRYKRNIVSNAEPHLNCEVLIKLDIKNFFETVTESQIRLWIEKVSYSKKVQSRLMELVFSTEFGLPQGAPTSPVLSNLVLRKADYKIARFCDYYGLNYTRYADDITISLQEDEQNIIGSVIKRVEEILDEEGFELNKKKGKIHVLRPHQAQRICGVTINSGKPTISRKQKRILRAARHRLENGKDATFTPQQLAGWYSYIRSVENSLDNENLAIIKK